MKESRLYSLFEKADNGSWVRISPLAYRKSTAVRVFQNALLAFMMGGATRERSLRVVKSETITVPDVIQRHEF